MLHVDMFPNHQSLNPMPIGSNCTVYEDVTLAYDMTSNAHSDRSPKNIIKEPLQDMDIIAKYGELKFNNGNSLVISRHNSDKTIEYRPVPMVGQSPNEINMINAKNAEITAFEHSSSINDQTVTMFWDKLNRTNCNKTMTSTNPGVRLLSTINEAESKNYIGTLQELCIIFGWGLPKYEYIQENVNESQKSWYLVICSAGPYKTKGKATTKRVAKRQAARLACEQINFSELKTSQLYKLNTKTAEIVDFGHGLSRNEAKNNGAINVMDGLSGNKSEDSLLILNEAFHSESQNSNINEAELKNYIGSLQELCVTRGWELPIYEYVPKNAIEFQKYCYSVVCYAGPYITTGEGNTKRMAKKQAARFAYEQINLSPQKSSTPCKYFKHETPKCTSNNMNKPIKYGYCDALKFMKLCSNQLSSSKKECVTFLKNHNFENEMNMNAYEFLLKLSKEEDFSNTFVQIHKDSVNVSIWVRVDILPLMVGLGIGKTEAEAKNVAAYSALIYIKSILTE